MPVSERDPYDTPAVRAGAGALPALCPDSEGWDDFGRRQVAAAVIAAIGRGAVSLAEKAAAWDSIPTPADGAGTAEVWREAYIARMREVASLRQQLRGAVNPSEAEPQSMDQVVRRARRIDDAERGDRPDA